MDPKPSDDTIQFIDETDASPSTPKAFWPIIIIDDEPDVHHATELALSGLHIEERPLEFIHAYSAEEARRILTRRRDIAVALLDVVMESPRAGLDLIRYLREELQNRSLRIILRTGQPGYAPEIDTIRDYDINDYKTKSEMTRLRLFTSLTVAIRSYWQIHQLEIHRHGLELIVSASTELSKLQGLNRFAEGVVTQLCALLGVSEEGIVCAAAADETNTGQNIDPYVLAAAGRYSKWIGMALDTIPDTRVRSVLKESLTHHHHFFGETTCLYFCAPGGLSIATFVDANHSLNEVNTDLLKVFSNNISVAFENTQLVQRITDLAFEDSLLKLPNRNSLIARIEQEPPGNNVLAIVDIDGFADINSVLDQEFGDNVLIAISRKLRQSFPANVFVARIGNDVFGVFGNAEDVGTEQINQVFSSPFDIEGEKFRLSATSGLLRTRGDPIKGVEMLKNASVALKQAKSFNRGKALCFEASHAIAARERMKLLNRLRLAFSSERLFLAYQPFVNLETNKIIGAEALLRWRTEQGEFVPPDSFIPLAEQSGLMVAIGDWVARTALIYLRHLIDNVQSDFRMAINVSYSQFREPDFVEKLVSTINELGVPTRNVEVELTESVAIDNIGLIEQKISALRAAGISIAIDDFGTGYSSLSILRQLNVDRLKIDRAFISGKDGKNEDFTIATIVLQLASQLKIMTIAEGIETDEQRKKLAELGCKDGQGYFFSKALAVEEFDEFLRQHFQHNTI